MSKEEEEDYLSDAWLQQLAREEQKLKTTLDKSYDVPLHKRRRQKESGSGVLPSRSELERIQREQGMNKEIQEENKGFELLKKMGYDKGMSLGHSDRAGPIHPISVDLKNNRMGLGLERERKEKEIMLVRRLEEHEHFTRGDYRARMGQRYLEKQVLSEIHQCRSVCEQLDKAQGKLESDLWTEESHDEEASSDLESLKAILEKLLTYLRDVYYYCHWCGADYADREDLINSCPGIEKEDH